MPKGIKDEKIWDKAKLSFKKSYGREPKDDKDWAVTMSIYKKMGGQTSIEELFEDNKILNLEEDMKLKDKNGELMIYRTLTNGAVVIKGKRQLYLNFKSADAGEKARKLISSNSFDKLFNKGKKIQKMGYNVSYIKLELFEDNKILNLEEKLESLKTFEESVDLNQLSVLLKVLGFEQMSKDVKTADKKDLNKYINVIEKNMPKTPKVNILIKKLRSASSKESLSSKLESLKFEYYNQDNEEAKKIIAKKYPKINIKDLNRIFDDNQMKNKKTITDKVKYANKLLNIFHISKESYKEQVAVRKSTGIIGITFEADEIIGKSHAMGRDRGTINFKYKGDQSGSKTVVDNNGNKISITYSNGKGMFKYDLKQSSDTYKSKHDTYELIDIIWYKDKKPFAQLHSATDKKHITVELLTNNSIRESIKMQNIKEKLESLKTFEESAQICRYKFDAIKKRFKQFIAKNYVWNPNDIVCQEEYIEDELWFGWCYYDSPSCSHSSADASAYEVDIRMIFDKNDNKNYSKSIGTVLNFIKQKQDYYKKIKTDNAEDKKNYKKQYDTLVNLYATVSDWIKIVKEVESGKYNLSAGEYRKQFADKYNSKAKKLFFKQISNKEFGIEWDKVNIASIDDAKDFCKELKIAIQELEKINSM